MITNHDLNEAVSLGNVTGLSLFETAVDRVYDALPERSDCRPGTTQ